MSVIDLQATSSRMLIGDLQSLGLRLADAGAGAPSRRGGAGPSDHKAVIVDGRTIMVPVHTNGAVNSPFVARAPGPDGRCVLERDGRPVAQVSFPAQPRFYAMRTFDGVPYWKIATLHGRDVLATTVVQECIRYANERTRCQFCAIGESLAGGRTVAYKTPHELAEVARAAMLLDGIAHVVLTTGTPNGTDRGARVLCESAAAIDRATGLPIAAQCEPPDDFGWFARLRASGVATLGMHLEAVEPEVRARAMPGKAKVPVSYYLAAFEAAVAVFGRGQLSTYLIAGLGDSAASLVAMSRTLIELGVYPFVVPLVPISGTRLEHATPPNAAFMREILGEIGAMLVDARLTSADIKAGCGKCGACSSLSVFET